MKAIVAVAAGLALLAAVQLTLGRKVPRLSRSGDVAGLDALRGLAALAILGFHSGDTSTSALPAWVGPFNLQLGTAVTLFFVLSGYLLSRPFLAAARAGRGIELRPYLTRRALRILPLLYLVDVLAFLRTQSAPLAHLQTLGANLLFLGRYGPGDILSVSWSLDNEVVFYLALPLIFLGAAALAGMAPGRIRLRAALGLVAALAIASSAYEVALNLSRQPVATGDALAKFHLFAMGIGLAALDLRLGSRRLGTIPRAALLAGALALWDAGVGLSRPDQALGDHLIGAGATLLMAAVVLAPAGSRFLTVMTLTPLLALGDWSYGLYLWHVPIQHVLFNLGLLGGSQAAGWAVMAAWTIPLAAGTYYLVERPAVGLGRRLTFRRAEAAAPAVAQVPA